MLKRYTVWLWTAVVFLLLTGAIHSISFFVNPTPQNETEKQLLFLLSSYKLDMGGGFHPTMGNLMTALSSCFTFLCVLGGLTIAYLLKKRATPEILRGIVGIHLLVIGACFTVNVVLTFLPPIILTGLCVLFLGLGFLAIPSAAPVET